MDDDQKPITEQIAETVKEVVDTTTAATLETPTPEEPEATRVPEEIHEHILATAEVAPIPISPTELPEASQPAVKKRAKKKAKAKKPITPNKPSKKAKKKSAKKAAPKKAAKKASSKSAKKGVSKKSSKKVSNKRTKKSKR
jgi:hypothetical protein